MVWVALREAFRLAWSFEVPKPRPRRSCWILISHLNQISGSEWMEWSGLLGLALMRARSDLEKRDAMYLGLIFILLAMRLNSSVGGFLASR